MSKTIEIPEFLIEMSKQLNAQNNRITADPIFQVRHYDYLVTEKGYDESHWELFDHNECAVVYSSKEHYDNVMASENFEENNKEWCNNWIAENIDSECIGEDSAFTDFFDFQRHYESGEDWPDGCNVIHLQKTEKIIKTCLTEADCEAFIKRKQRDYPELYIYVDSMVFCPQMIELRNWIMSLTKKVV